MKEASQKSAANELLKELPINEPIKVSASRSATKDDNNKFLLLNQSSAFVSLPNSLDEDVSIIVSCLIEPDNNSVKCPVALNAFNLNNNGESFASEELINFSQSVKFIRCYYKQSEDKWYIFKEEILPNVLEVDYLVTEDRSGLSIPPGAYGHKGGIPFFGDAPLGEQLRERLRFQQIQANAFTPQIESYHIGGFVVPAFYANESKLWNLRVEIELNSEAGGSIPAAGDDIYLLLRLGTGVADLTEGAYIKLTPTAILETRKLNAVISMTASTGQIRPNLTAASQEIITAANTTADATFKPFSPVDITNDPSLLKPENTETSLEFYLVANWTQALASITLITGLLELTHETVTFGQLE